MTINTEQTEMLEKAIEKLEQGDVLCEVTVLGMLREILSLQKTSTEEVLDQGATPPFGSKRAAALALYAPPFRFEHGYIFDSKNQMVSDDSGAEEHIAQRVRGWGRIGYMPDAEELQDEVGTVIAEALTEYWNKHNG